jgi:hypothetical protein
MTQYHAVMLDECGDEFGATISARNREAAEEKLRERYPESRGIVQLESPADTRERERRQYERANREYEGDFREWEYEQGY